MEVGNMADTGSNDVEKRAHELITYLMTRYIEKYREEAIKDILEFVYGQKEKENG